MLNNPSPSYICMVKITELIERWMDNLTNNALEPGSELKAFSKPLVGFASGDDELFSFIKDDIGYFITAGVGNEPTSQPLQGPV